MSDVNTNANPLNNDEVAQKLARLAKLEEQQAKKREWSREYYKKNPEKRLEQSRKYRENNKERLVAYRQTEEYKQQRQEADARYAARRKELRDAKKAETEAKLARLAELEALLAKQTKPKA